MNFDFNLAEFFKLPNKIIGALVLASGMILFLPEAIVGRMYMLSFRSTYGFALGLIFTISFSILIISLFVNLTRFLQNKYYGKRLEKTGKKRLESLDRYKKAIIYDLFLEDNHTGKLPLYDGAVRFLEHNMMIGKVTNQCITSDIKNPLFPYLLQPWVIKQLCEDSELKEYFINSHYEQVRKMEENYK